jgi:hypothetical protein
MKEIKVDEPFFTFYAYTKNQTTIVCPSCDFKKKIDATPYKGVNRALKVKCICGEAFKCVIEFRKCYRKKVNLSGEHFSEKTGKRGILCVEEISMGGLRFISLDPHNLGKGDTLEVKFQLDDPNKTEISKRAVVLHVKDLKVAIKFTDKDKWDKALGFYMMP